MEMRPMFVAAVLVVNFVTHTSHVVTGIFLGALLLLMSLDILTAFMSRKPPEAFGWNNIIKDKYFALILVVVSFIMDVVIYASAKFLPGEFPLVDSGMPFVTLTSLSWFIGNEIAQILGRYTRKGEIWRRAPPHLAFMADRIQWFFGAVSKVDNARWKETHKSGELPPERWWQKIPPEDLADILLKVDQLKESDVPPDPDKILRTDVEDL